MMALFEEPLTGNKPNVHQKVDGQKKYIYIYIVDS